MYKFNADVSRVLKLVIHSLYTNKDVFVRELISNAADACEKLRYLSITNHELTKENYIPKIEIQLDEKGNVIIFKDNGIGMNKDDLINHLGTIAKSGTNEFFEKIQNLETNSNSVENFIGQFGVGFYSSFMISDKIEVKTKKAGDNKGYSWVSDGFSGFDIAEIDLDFDHGTEILVHIREDERIRYCDKFNIENIIKTYSGNVSIPISFKNEEKIEEINPGKAIWLNLKSEISQEEYNKFYSSICYVPGEPFLTMHNKIEGNIEFTSLLFIPNGKPFDLYHPDRSTKIKLYVKHVFISEKDIDLLPKYLRFVYGIVDANNLPLNVSRETLQDNQILIKIKDSIIKKISSELKKEKEENQTGYDNFWKNFGGVLKEGLCEGTSDREGLMGLCKFYTSKSNNNLIDFDTYFSEMKEKQKDIYFFIGEKISDMLNASEMEAFLKYDIEVIFLTDPVDNFWTNVIHDHKGKDLCNIIRSDINFEDFKTSDEKKEDKENSKEYDEMTKIFVEALKGKIAAVKITTKLTDSPACLSTNPGSMDPRMEKLLFEQKQLNHISLKVLEINPNHELIKSTFELLKSDDQMKKSNGIEKAKIIFELTIISHGEIVENPANFAKKMFKIIK